MIRCSLIAELAASRDGEFLYAGVRGSNTIGTLRVSGDGSELQPVALADLPAAGALSPAR